MLIKWKKIFSFQTKQRKIRKCIDGDYRGLKTVFIFHLYLIECWFISRVLFYVVRLWEIRLDRGYVKMKFSRVLSTILIELSVIQIIFWKFMILETFTDFWIELQKSPFWLNLRKACWSIYIYIYIYVFSDVRFEQRLGFSRIRRFGSHFRANFKTAFLWFDFVTSICLLPKSRH